MEDCCGTWGCRFRAGCGIAGGLTTAGSGGGAWGRCKGWALMILTFPLSPAAWTFTRFGGTTGVLEKHVREYRRILWC